MIASTWLDLVVPTPFPHPVVGRVFDPAGFTSENLAKLSIAFKNTTVPL